MRETKQIPLWKLAMVNAGVLAALGALALGALELYLRLTVPASSGGSIFTYTRDTERYKVMKPNAAVIAFGEELRTNDLGFRDRAAEVPDKAPGEFRIVVLGDSFTVSAGVAFERIYTTKLERRLRERHPGVKVLNLAVGGYNIEQYAHVLHEVGLRLEPDLVLVAVFPENDFQRGTYELNRRVALGEASLPQRKWYERPYVYRAYGERINAKLERMFGEPAAAGNADEGWARNTAALSTMAHTVRERGISFKVALLPSAYGFDLQRERFERIGRFCSDQALTCLSLVEPFAAGAIAEKSLRLNRLDGHPNAKYNAVVAEHLAAYLSGYLAGRSRVSPSGGISFDGATQSQG
jgi:hypothetical protein